MNSGKDDKPGTMQQWGGLLSAGMVFQVSMAIGYAFGYYLDRWLGTTYLTIVFLLFGIAAGFISFFRTIAAFDRMNDENPPRK